MSNWTPTTVPQNSAEKRKVDELIEWGRANCHPNFRIDWEIRSALLKMRRPADPSVKYVVDTMEVKRGVKVDPPRGSIRATRSVSRDSIYQKPTDDYQPDDQTARNTRANADVKLPGAPTPLSGKRPHVKFNPVVDVGSLRKFTPTNPPKFITWTEDLRTEDGLDD